MALLRMWLRPILLYSSAGCAGLLSFLVVAWLALAAPHVARPVPVLALRIANLLLPALAAAHLLRVSASPHLRAAAAFAVYNWFLAAFYNTLPLAFCDQSGLLPTEIWASKSMRLVESVMMLARIVWSNMLVVQRIRALEYSAQRDFGMGRGAMLALPLFAASTVMRVLYVREAVGVEVAGAVMSTCLLFATPGLVLPIVRAWRALDVAKAEASGAAASRVHLAGRALRWQAVAQLGSWSVSSSILVHYCWNLQCHKELQGSDPAEAWDHCKAHILLTNVMMCLDEDFNALLALILSGALSGAAQGSQQRARSEKARKQRWLVSARRRREERLASNEAVHSQWHNKANNEAVQSQWHNKVKELAERGVTLEALLSFHRDLQNTMPHFDPWLHSTANVVHQAIIPLSSAQKTAMAPVIMQGKCSVPDMMVTHNWGNLWINLLAAVCADALEEPDYAKIAQHLARDPERVEQWIRQRGRLSRSYWICAFAVNQHLGICRLIGIPGHQDPVTGQVPLPCTCGAELALNHTPPLLPDGRSVPCEMNKFDDMIAYLSSQNFSFGQILVVDGAFQLFKRAWCIAEMVEAHHAGMAQQIKVQSEEGLGQHSEDLQLLRIQDMEAARQEDKDYILRSIGAKEALEAFNSQIRRLLLEDLLPSWSSLDLADQMALAGNVIRWHVNAPEQ